MQARSLPVALDEPRVRADLGRLLLARDDVPRARQLLQEAREGYRRLGLGVRQAHVEQLLRGC